MKIIKHCINLIGSMISNIITNVRKKLSYTRHLELELVKIHKHQNKTTLEDVKQAKAIAKKLGKDYVITINGEAFTVDWYVNQIIQNSRRSQFLSTAGLKFDGKATSSRDLAEQIAIHTHGTYETKRGREITTETGQKIKDPIDFVVYSRYYDFEKANDWISSKGEKISYYNEYNVLTNGIKIGKYVIRDATLTLGLSGKCPKKIHSLSVSIRPCIKTSNLSDCLGNVCVDIADIKRVIDQSKKLVLQDQAKLNAIVASAENFKEIE